MNFLKLTSSTIHEFGCGNAVALRRVVDPCPVTLQWKKMIHPDLVGGFNPSENISQIGSFPQVGVKIKFETTNQ